jgi:hypothetical protein
MSDKKLVIDIWNVSTCWVTNVVGTTRDKRRKKSWKHLWQTNTGLVFGMCSNVYCRNIARVGAHIHIGQNVRKWYIIPLCYKCNNHTNKGYMKVKKDVIAVEIVPL